MGPSPVINEGYLGLVGTMGHSPVINDDYLGLVGTMGPSLSLMMVN